MTRNAVKPKETVQSVVTKTWETVRDGFFEAYEKANAEQRKELLVLRDGARDAFYRAIAAKFDETDAYVQQLTRELAEANKKIAASLKSLKDIAEAVKFIASGVKTASALVSTFV